MNLFAMWKNVFLLLYITLLSFNLIKGDGNVTTVKPTTTEIATNTKTITTTENQIESLTKESSIESKLEALKKVTHRIVNGTSAVLGQFPHQVSLRRSPSGDHFCGGNILTPKWVLSAAHCVANENGINVYLRDLWVVAGEIYIKNDDTQAVSTVNRITIHPEFNYKILHNDVSLLGLETPICFNNRIHSLPLARAPTSAGAVCQVSGWGYQRFNGGVISKNLLYVDVPVVDISLCKILLKKYLDVPDKGVMCAGYLEGGRDACQGDSGGGMVCSGLLTGIVSGGLGCALPQLPGLYADIHVYTDWIEMFVNLTEEVKFCSSASSLASSLFVLGTAVILHASR